MRINEAAYEAFMAFLFGRFFLQDIRYDGIQSCLFSFVGEVFSHFQREITRYRNLDFPLLSEYVYTHNNLSRNHRRSERFCPSDTLGL